MNVQLNQTSAHATHAGYQINNKQKINTTHGQNVLLVKLKNAARRDEKKMILKHRRIWNIDQKIASTNPIICFIIFIIFII